MKTKRIDDVWDTLDALGKASGCHRMPERSFFFRGRQFPVCARCTGAFVGYLAGLFVFPFYQLYPSVCIIFCVLMFADWFIQKIHLHSSTNLRRLISGALCGSACGS